MFSSKIIFFTRVKALFLVLPISFIYYQNSYYQYYLK